MFDEIYGPSVVKAFNEAKNTPIDAPVILPQLMMLIIIRVRFLRSYMRLIDCRKIQCAANTQVLVFTPTIDHTKHLKNLLTTWALAKIAR